MQAYSSLPYLGKSQPSLSFISTWSTRGNQTVINILWALILRLLLQKLWSNWKDAIFIYGTEKNKYPYSSHLRFLYFHGFLPIANRKPKILFFSAKASCVHFHSVSLLFWFNICFNFNSDCFHVDIVSNAFIWRHDSSWHFIFRSHWGIRQYPSLCW